MTRISKLCPGFAALLLLISITVQALAHPPGKEGHGHDHVPAAIKKPAGPKGIILPDFPGPKPWSDKPVLDDPNRFQIAIMTDRTGGHRPGVWMKAVRSVNMLRPDFVVSVGDLIEGYTDDEKQARAEWKEFEGFIDKMDMKFFFVAGNHDVTNPMLHRIWREKFGPVWYSFDYKDVHFMCLCSEDPNFRIGDKQYEWIKQDLEKSKDARWTLVFIHKPLWFNSDRYLSFGIRDTTNWVPVEKLLADRVHTVFAGHRHSFAQYNRNGTKYYQLATTGGGSQLRGVDYGEFDHIMWLTMEEDGPRVTNLLLDGIVDPDEVTEESLNQFRKFLDKAKIEVSPILLDDAKGLKEGRIDIRLINEFDSPVSVRGRIEGLPLRGLTVDPVTLDLTAEAGKTTTISVRVRFGEEIPFADLEQTIFRAKVSSTGVKPFRAEQIIPVVIDRRHHCPRPGKPVKVDAHHDEWKLLAHATPVPPLLIGPKEQWQGAGDASFIFDVTSDDKFLYLAAHVTDDQVYVNGDSLTFILDARPVSLRSRQPSLGPGCFSVTFPAKAMAGKFRIGAFKERESNCQGAVRHVADGYKVEAAIPIELLTDQQGVNWHSFQCTLIAQDVDSPSEAPYSVVWRGTQGAQKTNKNFGHFVNTRP